MFMPHLFSRYLI